MNIGETLNKKGDKIHFYYDLGRGPGQRPTTGIFIYAKPNSQEQKNFNKEALKILETKKSQLTIEQQAIGTSIIPAHKFKANFVEYFEEYIKLNKREGNRHLTCCLAIGLAVLGIDMYYWGTYSATLPKMEFTQSLAEATKNIYWLKRVLQIFPALFYPIALVSLMLPVIRRKYFIPEK